MSATKSFFSKLAEILEGLKDDTKHTNRLSKTKTKKRILKPFITRDEERHHATFDQMPSAVEALRTEIMKENWKEAASMLMYVLDHGKSLEHLTWKIGLLIIWNHRETMVQDLTDFINVSYTTSALYQPEVRLVGFLMLMSAGQYEEAKDLALKMPPPKKGRRKAVTPDMDQVTKYLEGYKGTLEYVRWVECLQSAETGENESGHMLDSISTACADKALQTLSSLYDNPLEAPHMFLSIYLELLSAKQGQQIAKNYALTLSKSRATDLSIQCIVNDFVGQKSEILERMVQSSPGDPCAFNLARILLQGDCNDDSGNEEDDSAMSSALYTKNALKALNYVANSLDFPHNYSSISGWSLFWQALNKVYTIGTLDCVKEVRNVYEDRKSWWNNIHFSRSELETTNLLLLKASCCYVLESEGHPFVQTALQSSTGKTLKAFIEQIEEKKNQLDSKLEAYNKEQSATASAPVLYFPDSESEEGTVVEETEWEPLSESEMTIGRPVNSIPINSLSLADRRLRASLKDTDVFARLQKRLILKKERQDARLTGGKSDISKVDFVGNVTLFDSNAPSDATTDAENLPLPDIPVKSRKRKNREQLTKLSISRSSRIIKNVSSESDDDIRSPEENIDLPLARKSTRSQWQSKTPNRRISLSGGEPELPSFSSSDSSSEEDKMSLSILSDRSSYPSLPRTPAQKRPRQDLTELCPSPKLVKSVTPSGSISDVSDLEITCQTGPPRSSSPENSEHNTRDEASARDSDKYPFNSDNEEGFAAKATLNSGRVLRASSEQSFQTSPDLFASQVIHEQAQELLVTFVPETEEQDTEVKECPLGNKIPRPGLSQEERKVVDEVVQSILECNGNASAPLVECQFSDDEVEESNRDGKDWVSNLDILSFIEAEPEVLNTTYKVEPCDETSLNLGVQELDEDPSQVEELTMGESNLISIHTPKKPETDQGTVAGKVQEQSIRHLFKTESKSSQESVPQRKKKGLLVKEEKPVSSEVESSEIEDQRKALTGGLVRYKGSAADETVSKKENIGAEENKIQCRKIQALMRNEQSYSEEVFMQRENQTTTKKKKKLGSKHPCISDSILDEVTKSSDVNCTTVDDREQYSRTIANVLRQSEEAFVRPDGMEGELKSKKKRKTRKRVESESSVSSIREATGTHNSVSEKVPSESIENSVTLTRKKKIGTVADGSDCTAQESEIVVQHVEALHELLHQSKEAFVRPGGIEGEMKSKKKRKKRKRLGSESSSVSSVREADGTQHSDIQKVSTESMDSLTLTRKKKNVTVTTESTAKDSEVQHEALNEILHQSEEAFVRPGCIEGKLKSKKKRKKRKRLGSVSSSVSSIREPGTQNSVSEGVPTENLESSLTSIRKKKKKSVTGESKSTAQESDVVVQHVQALNEIPHQSEEAFVRPGDGIEGELKSKKKRKKRKRLRSQSSSVSSIREASTHNSVSEGAPTESIESSSISIRKKKKITRTGESESTAQQSDVVVQHVEALNEGLPTKSNSDIMSKSMSKKMKKNGMGACTVESIQDGIKTNINNDEANKSSISEKSAQVETPKPKKKKRNKLVMEATSDELVTEANSVDAKDVSKSQNDTITKIAKAQAKHSGFSQNSTQMEASKCKSEKKEQRELVMETNSDEVVIAVEALKESLPAKSDVLSETVSKKKKRKIKNGMGAGTLGGMQAGIKADAINDEANISNISQKSAQVGTPKSKKKKKKLVMEADSDEFVKEANSGDAKDVSKIQGDKSTEIAKDQTKQCSFFQKSTQEETLKSEKKKSSKIVTEANSKDASKTRHETTTEISKDEAKQLSFSRKSAEEETSKPKKKKRKKLTREENSDELVKKANSGDAKDVSKIQDEKSTEIAKDVAKQSSFSQKSTHIEACTLKKKKRNRLVMEADSDAKEKAKTQDDVITVIMNDEAKQSSLSQESTEMEISKPTKKKRSKLIMEANSGAAKDVPKPNGHAEQISVENTESFDTDPVVILQTASPVLKESHDSACESNNSTEVSREKNTSRKSRRESLSTVEDSEASHRSREDEASLQIPQRALQKDAMKEVCGELSSEPSQVDEKSNHVDTQGSQNKAHHQEQSGEPREYTTFHSSQEDESDDSYVSKFVEEFLLNPRPPKQPMKTAKRDASVTSSQKGTKKQSASESVAEIPNSRVSKGNSKDDEAESRSSSGSLSEISSPQMIIVTSDEESMNHSPSHNKMPTLNTKSGKQFKGKGTEKDVKKVTSQADSCEVFDWNEDEKDGTFQEAKPRTSQNEVEGTNAEHIVCLSSSDEDDSSFVSRFVEKFLSNPEPAKLAKQSKKLKQPSTASGSVSPERVPVKRLKTSAADLSKARLEEKEVFSHVSVQSSSIEDIKRAIIESVRNSLKYSGSESNSSEQLPTVRSKTGKTPQENPEPAKLAKQSKKLKQPSTASGSDSSERVPVKRLKTSAADQSKARLEEKVVFSHVSVQSPSIEDIQRAIIESVRNSLKYSGSESNSSEQLPTVRSKTGKTPQEKRKKGLSTNAGDVCATLEVSDVLKSKVEQNSPVECQQTKLQDKQIKVKESPAKTSTGPTLVDDEDMDDSFVSNFIKDFLSNPDQPKQPKKSVQQRKAAGRDATKRPPAKSITRRAKLYTSNRSKGVAKEDIDPGSVKNIEEIRIPKMDLKKYRSGESKLQRSEFQTERLSTDTSLHPPSEDEVDDNFGSKFIDNFLSNPDIAKTAKETKKVDIAKVKSKNGASKRLSSKSTLSATVATPASKASEADAKEIGFHSGFVKPLKSLVESMEESPDSSISEHELPTKRRLTAGDEKFEEISTIKAKRAKAIDNTKMEVDNFDSVEGLDLNKATDLILKRYLAELQKK